MRVPIRAFAEALAAYETLIGWGDLEYRPDRRATRWEAFMDLREGLLHLSWRVADEVAKGDFVLANSMFESAFVSYWTGGDLLACARHLTESLECLRKVRIVEDD